MQTEAVTIEERIALEQFKEVDKNYNDATSAVSSYAFKNAGRTATVEFALLQAKAGELAVERNLKLVAWGDLKKSSAPVRRAPGLKRTCTNCDSDLLTMASGTLHCN